MKHRMRYASLFLVAVLLFTTAIAGSSVYSVSGDEIPIEKITVGNVTLEVFSGQWNPVIVNGVDQGYKGKVRIGDRVKLTYAWSVTEENMTGIKAGDYFTMPIPTASFFDGHTAKKTSPENIYDPNDSSIIFGTYYIETVETGGTKQQQIVATLNQHAAEQTALTRGRFILEGRINAAAAGNVNLSAEAGATVSLQISEKNTNKGYGVWNPKTLVKQLNSIEGTKGTLGWTILVNYDNFKNLMEDKTVDKKEGLVLVDYLPAGLKLPDTKGVRLRATFYMPTPNDNLEKPGTAAGQLSWSAAGGYDYYIEETLAPMPAETYEAFFERIRTAGKNRPTYGVYPVTENGRILYRVIIGLGNAPSEFTDSSIAFLNTYTDFYARTKPSNRPATLKEHLEQAKIENGLEDGQIDKMKRIYGVDNPAGQPIVAWTVLLTTEVVEHADLSTFYGTGDYTNRVELYKENQVDPEISNLTIGYATSKAFVGTYETTSINVEKRWVGDDPTNPITVQLYRDGLAVEGRTVILSPNNKWMDTFRGLRKYRDEDAKIPYEYTFREIDPSPNYKVTYSNEVKNGRFYFQYITNTKLKNTETTQVKVSKIWNGTPGSSATIVLSADGSERMRVELSSVNNWTHTFENLPKLRDDDTPFQYTVTEVPVEGYDSSQVATDENGTPHIVITNTKKPDPVQVPDPSKTPDPIPSPSPDTEGTTDPTESQDSGVDYFPPVSTTTEATSTDSTDATKASTEATTSTSTTTTTSATTTANPSATSTLSSSENRGDGGGSGGGDSGSDYFAPTTTRNPLYDIDDDDAARGNAKRKKKGEAGYEEEEDGVWSEGLPNTGNLPNELFYAIGAFVSVLGLLVLLLQKLRL